MNKPLKELARLNDRIDAKIAPFLEMETSEYQETLNALSEESFQALMFWMKLGLSLKKAEHYLLKHGGRIH